MVFYQKYQKTPLKFVYIFYFGLCTNENNRKIENKTKLCLSKLEVFKLGKKNHVFFTPCSDGANHIIQPVSTWLEKRLYAVSITILIF